MANFGTPGLEEFNTAIKAACIAYINAIPSALVMTDGYVEAFGELIKASTGCRKVLISLHQTESE